MSKVFLDLREIRFESDPLTAYSDGWAAKPESSFWGKNIVTLKIVKILWENKKWPL